MASNSLRILRGSWSTSSSPEGPGWSYPHRASSQQGKPEFNNNNNNKVDKTKQLCKPVISIMITL